MTSKPQDPARSPAASAKPGSVSAASAEVAEARAELAAALDAIEDRLNPRANLARAKEKVQDSPPVQAAAGAGAAGLAAVVAKGGRLLSRIRK